MQFLQQDQSASYPKFQAIHTHETFSNIWAHITLYFHVCLWKVKDRDHINNVSVISYKHL